VGATGVGGCGSVRGLLHPGQRTVLPNADSGTVKTLSQCGHLHLKDTDSPPSLSLPGRIGKPNRSDEKGALNQQPLPQPRPRGAQNSDWPAPQAGARHKSLLLCVKSECTLRLVVLWEAVLTLARRSNCLHQGHIRAVVALRSVPGKSSVAAVFRASRQLPDRIVVGLEGRKYPAPQIVGWVAMPPAPIRPLSAMPMNACGSGRRQPCGAIGRGLKVEGLKVEGPTLSIGSAAGHPPGRRRQAGRGPNRRPPGSRAVWAARGSMVQRQCRHDRPCPPRRRLWPILIDYGRPVNIRHEDRRFAGPHD
jgi:hypothetical protein